MGLRGLSALDGERAARRQRGGTGAGKQTGRQAKDQSNDAIQGQAEVVAEDSESDGCGEAVSAEAVLCEEFSHRQPLHGERTG